MFACIGAWLALAGCDDPEGEACLVAFVEDTTLDVSLETAQVEITVEVDGGAPPDSGTGRGAVRLTREGGEAIDLLLTSTGPAVAAATVFAGDYRVEWIGDGDQDVLPRQNVVLAESLSIQGEARERFALERARIRGAIRVDGSPILAGAGARGVLRFARIDTGHVLELDLGREGELYDLPLLAGVYDVSIEGDPQGDVLPRQRATLASSMAISGDTERDFDLEIVRLSGELVLDGAAVPSGGNGSRGALVFSGENLGEVRAELGASGPAVYQVALFAGTYDVALRPALGAGVFPAVSAQVAAALELEDDATRDFELKTARLSGELTIDGRSLADEPSGANRGKLRFAPKAGGLGLSVPLGSNGPGRFDVVLFEGSYDVSLVGETTDSSVLPTQDLVLARDVVVIDETELDLGASTVTVSGQITVDGAEMAANQRSGAPRGVVRFQPEEGRRVEVPIGSAGPAAFHVRLFAGSYGVELVAGAEPDQDAIPAQEVVLEEARTLDQPADLLYDVATVEIRGEVTLDGQPLPDAGSERGSIAFVRSRGRGEVKASLGSSGPAMYAVTVLAGSHDVMVEGLAPALPVQTFRRIASCESAIEPEEGDGTGVDFGEEGGQEEPTVAGRWSLTAAQALWGTWTFDFQQSGEQLDGSFSQSIAGTGEIENGSFAGGQIRFDVRTAFGCLIEFRGQLDGECAMSGTLRDTSCPNTVPTSDWTAVCE